MRGFLAGSLALIVLYVAVQPGNAAKAQTGSNTLVSLLRRALSPQVAGVPNRARNPAAPAAAQPSAVAPSKPGTIPV